MTFHEWDQVHPLSWMNLHHSPQAVGGTFKLCNVGKRDQPTFLLVELEVLDFDTYFKLATIIKEMLYLSFNTYLSCFCFFCKSHQLLESPSFLDAQLQHVDCPESLLFIL